MQNNLDEYYTMVNFICENLLGEKREFNNRYKNPIEAGKSKDATWQQVLTGFYTLYPYNFILIKEKIHAKTLLCTLQKTRCTYPSS
jgi:SNF2 family DNA or RNA helicase